MSPPPPPDRAEGILIDALDRGIAEREAFLLSACGEDAVLLAEVRALLAAHEAMPSGFLAEPAVKDLSRSVLDVTVRHAALTGPVTAASEREGECIGRYKLLQQIGEGGFGTVWMAEQTEPVTRRVALKIIKLGMDTREVIARFEQERQALAMMDHPNIAKVFDAGATDKGRPFFVMELVKGMPITQYCDEAGLGTRERLALFGDVCAAINHAHQKGIIHRDIKPSNVMVTLHGDKPVVKVIDFGIAKATQGKLTDKTLFTRFDQFVGTPVYMSPEQASMSGLDIDTRSDIYALGILLYELLVGKPPFDGKSLLSAGYEEMRRIIREVEPPKPSSRLSTVTAEERSTLAKARQIAPEKLSRLVEPDLDWIVMKAIEKDRSRRYETANAFAQDIVRFLADEPVSATPPSAGYRFGKWVRRNKATFAAGSAIAASLIIGLSVSTWLFFKEKSAHTRAVTAETQTQQALVESNVQRDKAESAQSKAEKQLYIADMNLAQRAWDEAHVSRVEELLAAHRPQPGGPDLRSFEWYYLEHLCNTELLTLRGPVTEVTSVAFSPDGRRLVSAGPNNSGSHQLDVWDSTSGQMLLKLTGHKGSVLSVAFSPDGSRLASGSADKTVWLWDVTSGKTLFKLAGHAKSVASVAFSPDGKRLASASDDRTVKIWDITSGQEILTFKRHTASVRSVAFSHDGKRVVTAENEFEKPGEVKIWDSTNGQEIFTLRGHTGGVWSVAFSPDGKWLATGSGDKVKIWDATNGQEIFTLKGHTGIVTSVAFSPDGKRLASGSGDSTVKVWDTTSGQEMRTFKGHTNGVRSVVFSPDGKRIVSGSSDKTVKIWDATTDPGVLSLKAHAGTIHDVAFSPDGTRLASASSDQTIKVWDTGSHEAVLVLKGHIAQVRRLAFSPDGKRLVSAANEAGEAGEVKLWDATSGREMFTFKGDPRGGRIDIDVAFSPDGKRVVVANFDAVVAWDAVSGQEVLTLKASRAHCPVFSPDGRRLAAAEFYRVTGNDQVKIWDATTGQEIMSLNDFSQQISRLAFSPDGKRLAAAARKNVMVWDTLNGQEIPEFKGHANPAKNVAFSPDGKRLASASANGEIKVWDAVSGQEMLTLSGGTTLAFSPDGKRLASAGDDQTVRFWGTISGPEPLVLPGGGSSLAFSRDGKQLTSASPDQTIKLWDIATAKDTLTWKAPAGRYNLTMLNPDGKRLATASANDPSRNYTEVKVWDSTNGQELLAVHDHNPPVNSLALSPDGKRLATGLADGTVKVWDAMTGREPLLFKAYPGRVNSLAFSPDGKRLASGSKGSLDGTVKLWDATNGEKLLTLAGHAYGVTHVVFSADGKRLASVNDDYRDPGEIKVWDATSGQEIRTLKGFASGFYGVVALSPDGKKLATVNTWGSDNKVKLWDVTSGQELVALKGPIDKILSLEFSPDGTRLAAGGVKEVEVWDITKAQEGSSSVSGRAVVEIGNPQDETKISVMTSVEASPKVKDPEPAPTPPVPTGQNKNKLPPELSQRINKAFGKLSPEARNAFISALRESRDKMADVTDEERSAFVEKLLNRIEAEDQAKKPKTP